MRSLQLKRKRSDERRARRARLAGKAPQNLLFAADNEAEEEEEEDEDSDGNETEEEKEIGESCAMHGKDTKESASSAGVVPDEVEEEYELVGNAKRSKMSAVVGVAE